MEEKSVSQRSRFSNGRNAAVLTEVLNGDDDILNRRRAAGRRVRPEERLQETRRGRAPPRLPPPPLSLLLLLLLQLQLLLLLPRASRAQTQSATPTPRPAVCALPVYSAVWDYEMRYRSIPVTAGCLSVDRVSTSPRVVDNVTGLLEQWCPEDGYHSVMCAAQIQLATQQPFGPPSAFELMNVVCKGACMSYYNRYKRLKHSEYVSGCYCAKAGKVQCPKHPLELLFTITGFSYDPDFYWESTCQPYSCGRFLQNEADYREARKACKLNFDGAAAARPAAAAIALAALGAMLVLHGGDARL